MGARFGQNADDALLPSNSPADVWSSLLPPVASPDIMGRETCSVLGGVPALVKAQSCPSLAQCVDCSGGGSSDEYPSCCITRVDRHTAVSHRVAKSLKWSLVRIHS